ncbi:MAG: ABC-F family ATP-binding cassette domain-containing protein, partial [Oscillospiraceae bacterium]|nr:ABC-F family ATP-binding cassette domain-containing protein [Oscillospiraceae bacterium]
MIEISVSGLVKEYEVGSRILDGLTFQIDTGERVGLLGKNGSGKTTVFRILTGEVDWDEGEVMIAPGKRLGLISQIPVYPAGYTVEDVLDTAFERLKDMERELSELTMRMGEGNDPNILRRYDALTAAFEAGGGYDTDTQKNKVCNGLTIPQSMREQLFDDLSGGEKTRVNLARLILEDTDVLLLDEPTNHLDLHAVEWLEEYLKKFKGTVLAISHDRYFLDRVVDRVIEIQDGKAEFYEGNYTFYAVEKERRFEEKLKQYEKEQAKIEQMEKAAEQLRVWAYSGMDKTFRRAKSMEKRIERMRTVDKPTKDRKLEMGFGEREFHGDEVLTTKGLAKGYGDRVLFSGLDLEIIGGERIGLIGDNGTGKSTLIKLITGEEQPD